MMCIRYIQLQLLVLFIFMERVLTQQFFDYIEKAQSIVIVLPELSTFEAASAAEALRRWLVGQNKQVALSVSGVIPVGFSFLDKAPTSQPLPVSTGNLVVELATLKTPLDELSYTSEDGKVIIFLKARQGNFSPDDITVSQDRTGAIDLVITLGASSLDDLGDLFKNNAELFYAVPKIAIDTQARSEYFGAVNVIDVTVSSHGELLAGLLSQETTTAMDAEVATLLLASIIGATNSFQDVRTTPKTLAVAAQLIELGARQQDIIVSLFKTRDFALLKLWGRVLARIKTSGDQLLYSSINAADFTKTATSANELLPAMRELLDNISGYQVVSILAETEPGSITAVIGSLPHVTVRSFITALSSGDVRVAPDHGMYRLQHFQVAAQELSEAEDKLLENLPKLSEQSA